MPGGGTIRIETRSTELADEQVASRPWLKEGRYVQLSVSDTGCGMDASTQEHLFEPFFTTKEPGTGLGLATVYGIVTQHGGLVEVTTAPGEGTEVRVALPAIDPAPDEASPVPAAPPQEIGVLAGAQGDETILVVEDEPEVRQVIVELLAGAGYRILEAGDGIEALERLRRTEPSEVDLIISDVVMPRMGGRELFEKVQDTAPGTAFLFSSGYGEGLIDSGLVNGERAAFIAKPYGLDELTARVRALLDARRQRSGRSRTPPPVTA
jgi:two-component system, cell cycle sensor histidine kinase and response regulator CckA